MVIHRGLLQLSVYSPGLHARRQGTRYFLQRYGTALPFSADIKRVLGLGGI